MLPETTSYSPCNRTDWTGILPYMYLPVLPCIHPKPHSFHITLITGRRITSIQSSSTAPTYWHTVPFHLFKYFAFNTCTIPHHSVFADCHFILFFMGCMKHQTLWFFCIFIGNVADCCHVFEIDINHTVCRFITSYSVSYVLPFWSRYPLTSG